MKQTKIRLYGTHIGYVNTEFLIKFQRECKILNINSWIKEQCFKDWDIYLNTIYDIEELKIILNENYYENIAEWLKEKIRFSLLNLKNNKEV